MMMREKVVEHEYEVDYIIDKARTPSGKKIYRIKWKYYDNNFNTWEPEENIDKRLITEFETTRKYKQKLYNLHVNEMIKNKLKTSKYLAKIKKEIIPEKNENPFNYGPSQVVKVDKEGTDFVYTIKWMDGKESKIPSDIASKACPQLVLDYYFDLLEEIK